MIEVMVTAVSSGELRDGMTCALLNLFQVGWWEEWLLGSRIMAKAVMTIH